MSVDRSIFTGTGLASAYMLSEGTRRFDLYDFFSVLLPGGAFVVGLAPFLPRNAPVFSVGAIAIGILLGFVFGRAIHALGLLLETPVGDNGKWFSFFGYDVVANGVSTGHRDYFTDQVRNANDISPGLVDEFYSRARTLFGDLDLERRVDLSEEDDPELETLYTLVRSQIHMDSRGRSRTFQAVLDFQRTMMVASLLLFGIYIVYAIFAWSGTPSPVGYETYLSYLDPELWLVVIAAIILPVGAYTTFERIRTNYRRYFIQYLMADFIAIHKSAEVNIPLSSS